jgi:hypothetical protein
MLISNLLTFGKAFVFSIQNNLMKTIQHLLETLKEIIAEATENHYDYDDMRLIPIPVKSQERNLPISNRNNH